MPDENGLSQSELEALRQLVGADVCDQLLDRGLRLTLRPGEHGDTEISPNQLREVCEEAVHLRARADRLATLGEMTAGIVHDLRNMITSIKGFAELAGRRLDQPEKARPLLDQIERESMASLARLERFLAYARAEPGGLETFDVAETVRSAAALVSPQLRTHAVKLLVEIPDQLPNAVGRAEDLKQALINLALNAHQAMPKGGTVQFRVAARGRQVEVVVEDDGPGVPEALRKRVFELFFTTRAKSGGTGLGLTMSARLLAQSGGSLELDEQTEHGARFVIRLPCEASAIEPAE